MAVVTSFFSNAGTGTLTLNFAPSAPAAIASGHTFRTLTGRYFVLNAGTVAAGIFKVFDAATMAWQTALATTNLPASIGTDGRLVLAYNYGEIMATGTSTGTNTTTTLNNTGKTWTVNQWTNYQVRITGGTGLRAGTTNRIQHGHGR